MRSERYINLTFGLLYKEELTKATVKRTANKDDQWNEGQAVIQTDVFVRMCLFSPGRLRER